MDGSSNPKMDKAEIDRYLADGFVVPKYRLPPSRVARLRSLTTQMIEDNPARRNEPIVGTHLPNGGPLGKLKNPRAQEWMEIATDPGVLDVAEQVLGPDIVLWSTTLFYKEAKGGPATPWHRDGAYWPIEPLATATIWIAVFDSVIDNGCLRCIPGSHREKKIGDHIMSNAAGLIFPNTLAPDQFDEALAEDIKLEAGQMVVFDVYTVHGARQNLGTRHRAGYSLRLMPATSHFDHQKARRRSEGDYPDMRPGENREARSKADAQFAVRPLYLVRGQDRGHNDLQMGKTD